MVNARLVARSRRSRAAPPTVPHRPPGAVRSGGVRSVLREGERGVSPDGWLLRADGLVARVRPWPDEPGTVQLVTLDQSDPPSAITVRRWLGELCGAGVRVVRTGALGPSLRPAYLEAGFTVRQELALLHHGLTTRPAALRRRGAVSLRSPRRRDLVAFAVIDRRAFGPTWGMDVVGIVDACRATPIHRLRVATDGADVVGYAISGRAGHGAYLQRLAVDPSRQGEGIGHALVVDSLTWARGHGCTGLLVNTHVDNASALGLYRSLGFVEMSYHLAVLERTLT